MVCGYRPVSHKQCCSLNWQPGGPQKTKLPCAPVHTHLVSVVKLSLWLQHAGQAHTPSTHILVLHQLLSMLTLLLTGILGGCGDGRKKGGGQARQGDVMENSARGVLIMSVTATLKLR